ncbi:hypothetical protein, partial [Bacillus cereus]
TTPSININIVQTIEVLNAAPAIPAGQPYAGNRDIAAIYQQYDICRKMNSGEIDHVWMWSNGFDSPYPAEFTINGALGFRHHGSETQYPPQCGNAGTVFSFVYANRGKDLQGNIVWGPGLPSQALHDYGHWFEDSFVDLQRIPGIMQKT